MSHKLHLQIQSFIVLLLSILLSSNVFALDSDLSKPVTIDADTAISNGFSETTVYKGNVKVTQGSLTLQADSVTLQMANNKLTTIVAKGNKAKLSQRPRPSEGLVTASAYTITYNIKQQTAVLAGNAKLNQDGRQLTSNSITYDFTRKLVKANAKHSGKKKSGRVHVVIPPVN